ncbi:MAG: YIP1 family protein [Pseudomonadota bacterium]
MNDLSVAASLATAPSKAFMELRGRPRFLLPLFTILLSSIAVVAWYYSVVDFDWLKELIFSNNPDVQKLPPEQRAAAMNFVGRNTMLFGSVFGVLVGVPFVYVLTAVYYLVAAKVTKVPLGFKHWFTLVCWVSLPGLLSTVAAVISLLLRDNNQIPPGVLQPLSLNELVFHVPVGSKSQPFLEALNVPVILSCILAVIGVHTWTQRSWLCSSIVAVLPVVLLYGIWAIFAFR